MAILTANTIPNLPTVKSKSNFSSFHPGRLSIHFLPLDAKPIRLGPVGLPQKVQPTDRRSITYSKYSNGIRSASIICAAALNARCSAEQTQTVTREAPTITSLPGKEKDPLLDDGGSGFPPRDDGDGGGGGGGGGGNWSGGFFFFGFLAFLGFLKDKESEEDYRDSRR